MLNKIEKQQIELEKQMDDLIGLLFAMLDILNIEAPPESEEASDPVSGARFNRLSTIAAQNFMLYRKIGRVQSLTHVIKDALTLDPEQSTIVEQRRDYGMEVAEKSQGPRQW